MKNATISNSPVRERFQVGQIAAKLEPNFLKVFYVVIHQKKSHAEIPSEPPFLGGMCDVISGFFENIRIIFQDDY